MAQADGQTTAKHGSETLHSGLARTHLASIYEPLPDPCKYIRLLKMLHVDDEDCISCSMSVHAIESEWKLPKYVAISYVWGHGNETKTVHVNNFPVDISKNAHQALRQVRCHSLTLSFPMLIWIDSICINQASREEKASQVAIMNAIFAWAHLVAACLHDCPSELEAELRSCLKGDGEMAWGLKLDALSDLSELAYFSRL